MNKLKLSTLNSLALHCGYPTATTKQARLAAIFHYEDFITQLGAPRPLNVLSVDVGIKNFSYCKASYKHLALPTVDIFEWNHLNLHDKFGADYTLQTGDPTSLVDSKAYIAKLAVDVVDHVFFDPNWTPNIITIENQRTRSNGNTSTLPNVLLNFTLENMLYAACSARIASSQNTKVIPMNASKMINFWLSRFIEKGHKLSGSRSKSLRTQLLYGWLSHPQYAPFAFGGLNIPPNFVDLSMRAKTNALLDQLSFDNRPKKVDDLVDCYLYNLMCVLQLRHHNDLRVALLNDEDITALVHRWDIEHCNYLHPVLESFNLELNKSYV